ncbi:hypothetical protein [Streptomyces phaeochromogenes]|uniref:hypothetical protein n=1 Tax=Streptomyces phaeochromogenes TaxID=1923 RepID=UPI003710697E
MLNVDDETGHMEPRSAAGVRGVTAIVTATGGRSRRAADGASVPHVAYNGGAHIGGVRIGGACSGDARIGIARNGDAHSRIARGGVPHADVLDGTRHDTDGPEHRTSGPQPRTAGLTSAPTIHSGRGAANAGTPTEAGR